MARPSKWDEAFVRIAREASRLGATDADLADILGVSVRTVRSWQVEKPDFAKALRLGKAVADGSVERSLYQRALGYEHDETDIRVVGTRLVKTPMRKHYPPDTTAAIFWLKNRKPKEWRDKQQLEHTGPGGGPVQSVSMTSDEFRSIAKSVADEV